MKILICPVCKNSLTEVATQYQCELHHVFDKSRDGYVNLLLNQMKNSTDPGDNKLMVKSRSCFLSRGYYAAISDMLNVHVKEKLSSLALPTSQIADIGCGNGYYLRNLKQYLPICDYWGIDISKEAIKVAAKESANIKWIVSNIAELPFHSQSFDAIISVFSPLHFKEFNRLLKINGYLFVIYPASQHLYELREILFSDVKKIDKDRILHQCEGSLMVDSQIPLQYSIELNSNEDIVNLFSMTPYYWRCTPEKRQQVLALDSLKLTIDVTLWVFKPSTSTM